jgi:hypothetical protein
MTISTLKILQSICVGAALAVAADRTSHGIVD